MKHHLNGPSNLERRALCPASLNIERRLPECPSNPDAESGTNMHKAIELMINNQEIDMLNLSPDDFEMIKKCFDFIKGIAGKNSNIFTESTMRLFDADNSIITFGTADVVIITADGELIVIDWKFGRLPVEYAKDNIQLATLAAMAMQKYDKQSCTVMIIQPYLNRWKDNFEFTNFESIRDYVKDIIAKCESVTAGFNPGEKQCKYCRGMAHAECPAVNNMALALMDRKQDIEKQLETMPADNLSILYEKLKVCNSLMNKVKFRIKQICEKEGSCGNLTIKKSSGGFECTDTNGLYTLVSEYMSTDEFMDCCSVSVAKIRDNFSRKLKDAGEIKSLDDGKERFMQAAIGFIKAKSDKTEIKVEK
jgi:hypothetical protein